MTNRIAFLLATNQCRANAVRAKLPLEARRFLFLETWRIRTLWGGGPHLERIWTKRRPAEDVLYITGGCGALYDGASPDGREGSKEHHSPFVQAYARNYNLA